LTLWLHGALLCGQIVLTALGEMLSSSDVKQARRGTQAMPQGTKLDSAALQQASEMGCTRRQTGRK
jgi:hypothetical protein